MSVRGLCHDFITQSSDTWFRIRNGRLTRIYIHEESITDYNLLTLQMKHPHQISTQKFTKRMESIQGADWEWWLGSNAGWLGLRVQAKKLNSRTLRYTGLDHTTSKGRQIDLLINHSMSRYPPKIPIYTFYNYWDVRKYVPPWLCCSYPRSYDMLGCGLSDAHPVRAMLNRGTKDLRRIAGIMYPWSCLICCHQNSPRRRDRLLPSRSFDFLASMSQKLPQEPDRKPYDKQRFIVEEAPYYVYRIMEGSRLSIEEWKEIGTKRVAVIYEPGHGKSHSRVKKSLIFT